MKFYLKYKEKILYLFFGGLTTLISLSIYYIFTHTIFNPRIALDLQITNILSWLIGFLFAFFTNRKFVFESKNNIKKEFLKFFASRIFTLLLDMLIMFIFVTICGFNDILIKIVSQIVTVITNYVLSKLIVFKKGENDEKISKTNKN